MPATPSKNITPILLILAFLLLVISYLYLFNSHPVFWPGVAAMGVFYALIFYLGSTIAKKQQGNRVIDILLAGRGIPLFLAVFTMSATWVGGGFINGTAEYAYSSGLVWVQAPWGYALSLIIGGIFFAKKMRRFQFNTMLDPLAQRFGRKMGGIYFIPALLGEIFWTAAILTALGTTFGTVLGLETNLAIVLSAVIAIAYTAIGGLWAVAITDLVQMILLMIGLLLVIPFALPSVGGLAEAWTEYRSIHPDTASFYPTQEALGSYYWNWWDSALLLIFGGIPWQVYFQRVLSAKDEKTAMWLSIIAGIVCLFAAIPALLIGIIGTVTPWSTLGLETPPDAASVLPWVMRYLTPPWIATIGLGAIAAAVMSSVDSSILSASSMAAWNVYRPLIKPGLKSDHLVKIIKRCVWIIGVAATILALNITSVYQLWFLCSDFVYCLIFPALVCALFDPKANLIGAIAGFSIAAILRFGGGDPVLGLPILLPYPMIEDGLVLFPFRTLSMACGLLGIIGVSRLTQDIQVASPLHRMN